MKGVKMREREREREGKRKRRRVQGKHVDNKDGAESVFVYNILRTCPGGKFVVVVGTVPSIVLTYHLHFHW
jgi:hypothetical protein